ncbi:MAG: hypothetical protein GF341_13635 [candidate division Zixibacteria bacterium]|nr:hypothetical protein [candidate division Zixibacteria bacterium]
MRGALLLLLVLALLVSVDASADLWESSCADALRRMSEAQETVASKYEVYATTVDEVKEARRAAERVRNEIELRKTDSAMASSGDVYEFDTAIRALRDARRQGDQAVAKINQWVLHYNAALEDLQTAIDEFAASVDSFSTNCQY